MPVRYRGHGTTDYADLGVVQDLHIRIIDAATGELLQDLTLNPARNYQRNQNPRRPRRQTP